MLLPSNYIYCNAQTSTIKTVFYVCRVWDQCNVVQDYLTVYDGASTSDRVLVRLCGGDAVPDIVSSRNSMLLEFHTSPYDNPFHPVPLSFLPGFELEVKVNCQRLAHDLTVVVVVCVVHNIHTYSITVAAYKGSRACRLETSEFRRCCR